MTNTNNTQWHEADCDQDSGGCFRCNPYIAAPLPANCCSRCERHLSECYHPAGEKYRKGGKVEVR